MAEKADSEVAVADAAEEEPPPCELPVPPFTSEMGYMKDSELQCFLAGCQKKRKGFWSLLSHIKGYHTKNRVPKEWLTSYFIQEANKEQKQLRLARIEKMKAHVKSNLERGKGSGTGRVVGRCQQAMEQQADVGKQALTDGIVARSIDEATNYTYVIMPGESSKMWLPNGVGEALVASGFLILDGEGNVTWNPVIPAITIQEQILDVLPNGSQRKHLEAKFQITKTSPPQLLQPLPVVSQSSGSATPVCQDVLLMPGAGMDDVMKTQCAIMADLRKLMNDLNSNQSKAPSQTLKIVKDFNGWKQPTGWDEQLRRNFPFEVKPIPDQELVKSFSLFMEVRQLKENSRQKYIFGLERFIMMLETVDGSPLDCKNILLNVARSKLYEQMQALDILKPDYSCTLATVQALGHFAVMTKLRLATEGDRNGADMVDVVMMGVLDPWTRVCAQERRDAAAKKYSEDAKTIEDFHTPTDLNALAYSLYLDLMTIHKAVCGADVRCGPTLMFKATSCVIGLLYVNGLPSRSMELQTLTAKVVKDFLNGNDMFFEVQLYKTAKFYGIVSMWIHNANRKALKLHDEIRSKFMANNPPETAEQGDLYFQPQPFYVHCHLRAISKSRELEPQLKVNMMRKAFAVWAKIKKAEDCVLWNDAPISPFSIFERIC